VSYLWAEGSEDSGVLPRGEGLVLGGDSGNLSRSGLEEFLSCGGGRVYVKVEDSQCQVVGWLCPGAVQILDW